MNAYKRHSCFGVVGEDNSRHILLLQHKNKKDNDVISHMGHVFKTAAVTVVMRPTTCNSTILHANVCSIGIHQQVYVLLEIDTAPGAYLKKGLTPASSKNALSCSCRAFARAMSSSCRIQVPVGGL